LEPQQYWIQEALQPKDSHSPEVGGGVVTLETNILPLLGYPRFKARIWHQLRPQLCGGEGRKEGGDRGKVRVAQE